LCQDLKRYGRQSLQIILGEALRRRRRHWLAGARIVITNATAPTLAMAAAFWGARVLPNNISGSIDGSSLRQDQHSAEQNSKQTSHEGNCNPLAAGVNKDEAGAISDLPSNFDPQ
jgi:hypothetical protein